MILKKKTMKCLLEEDIDDEEMLIGKLLSKYINKRLKMKNQGIINMMIFYKSMIEG